MGSLFFCRWYGRGGDYVVLDGTLIPIDRVAADRPFCSGKHKKHGMNPQVIASPTGDVRRVSGALPGSAHRFPSRLARARSHLAAQLIGMITKTFFLM
jgi:hypothetical protein